MPTVRIVLRVELHEIERILILHPMVALAQVNYDMLRTERSSVLRRDLFKTLRLLSTKGGSPCVQVPKRLHDGLRSKCLLQVRLEFPLEHLEIDGLVEVADTDPV